MKKQRALCRPKQMAHGLLGDGVKVKGTGYEGNYFTPWSWGAHPSPQEAGTQQQRFAL